MRTDIKVNGMTCGHCVQAVTNSLTAVPGIDDVSVDLGAALVTFTSAEEIALDSLREAVDDAGFEFAGVAR